MTGRPQLVAEIDTDGTFSVQVDDEPGSTKLAAQFARDLAAAALRFAQRGTEVDAWSDRRCAGDPW